MRDRGLPPIVQYANSKQRSFDALRARIITAQACHPEGELKEKWSNIGRLLNELSGPCSSSAAVYDKAQYIMAKLNELMQQAVQPSGKNILTTRSRSKSRQMIREIVRIRDEVYRVYQLEAVRYGESLAPSTFNFTRVPDEYAAVQRKALRDGRYPDLNLMAPAPDSGPTFSTKAAYTTALASADAGILKRAMSQYTREEDQKNFTKDINQHSGFIYYQTANAGLALVNKKHSSELTQALTSLSGDAHAENRQALTRLIRKHSNFIPYQTEDGSMKLARKDDQIDINQHTDFISYQTADAGLALVDKSSSSLTQALTSLSGEANARTRQALTRLIRKHSNFMSYYNGTTYQVATRADLLQAVAALSGETMQQNNLIAHINQGHHLFCYSTSPGGEHKVCKYRGDEFKKILQEATTGVGTAHVLKQLIELYPARTQQPLSVKLFAGKDADSIVDELWNNSDDYYYKTIRDDGDRIILDPSFVFPTTIDEYKYADDGENAPIVLRDLHANLMLAVNLLQRAGAINITKEDFNQLAKNYSALAAIQAITSAYPDVTIDHSKVQEITNKINTLIDKIPVTPSAARVMLIGDFTGDRGVSDSAIVRLFAKPGFENMDVLASNHGDLAELMLLGLGYKEGNVTAATLVDHLSALEENLGFDNFILSLGRSISSTLPGLPAIVASVSHASQRPSHMTYPLQSGSTLQDLYNIYRAPEGEKTTLAERWFADKAKVDSRTQYIIYDDTKHILYSHAPAPVECFLRVAKLLLDQGLEGDLAQKAPGFAQSCKDDLAITQYAEDFVHIGSHKIEFKEICDCINKQYALYLSHDNTDGNDEKRNSVFVAQIVDARDESSELNDQAMRENPAGAACWTRQNHFSASIAGKVDEPNGLARGSGHDESNKSTGLKLCVFDGFSGKVPFCASSRGVEAPAYCNDDDLACDPGAVGPICVIATPITADDTATAAAAATAASAVAAATADATDAAAGEAAAAHDTATAAAAADAAAAAAAAATADATAVSAAAAVAGEAVASIAIAATAAAAAAAKAAAATDAAAAAAPPSPQSASPPPAGHGISVLAPPATGTTGAGHEEGEGVNPSVGRGSSPSGSSDR